MGKREHYEPGTFCWVDLQTTDPAGAKAFYTDLFGWEAEDMPAGEAGTYTVLSLGGDEVCAMYEMDAGQREQGIPSYWLSYVSVEDADATAARARELGGKVYGDAFDVLDVGRMERAPDPRPRGGWPILRRAFTVSSRDETVEQVQELGGALLYGPLDLPSGKVAVLADPQGAAFALFEGETEE